MSPAWASTCCTCRPSIPSAGRTGKGATTRWSRSRATGGVHGHLWPRRTHRGTPDLGSLADFDALVAKAKSAARRRARHCLQCSPDHPYPRASRMVPATSGRIQYAENPPKRYQDISPFDFEPLPGHRSGLRYATSCSSGSGMA
jgi:hypothetical protein